MEYVRTVLVHLSLTYTQITTPCCMSLQERSRSCPAGDDVSELTHIISGIVFITHLHLIHNSHTISVFKCPGFQNHTVNDVYANNGCILM